MRGKAGQASNGDLQLAEVIIELPLEIILALCFFRLERSGFCGEMPKAFPEHPLAVRRLPLASAGFPCIMNESDLRSRHHARYLPSFP